MLWQIGFSWRQYWGWYWWQNTKSQKCSCKTMYGMQESCCEWVRYRTNKAVCSWLSRRHSWLCRMREWRRCCGIFHFIIVGDAWLKIIGSYARYVAIKQGWRSEKTPYLKISLCTVRSAGGKPLSMWNNFIQQLSKSQTHRRTDYRLFSFDSNCAGITTRPLQSALRRRTAVLKYCISSRRFPFEKMDLRRVC